MGTKIAFARPDGKETAGYLAKPGRANAPGIIVIQEWWGLQDQIKGICDRFALAGYEALAPDLYSGVVVPYHDHEAAGREMNSLNFMGLHRPREPVRACRPPRSRSGSSRPWPGAR